MIGFIIGIFLSLWVWRTVKDAGRNPLWWALGTIVIWPIFTTIVGFRYGSRGLAVVGILGLLLILGLVVIYVTTSASILRHQ